MKICADHWEKLRKSLDEKGLTPFISGDGRKVAEKIEHQMLGAKGPDVFDPLMGANFAIWSNALEMGGMYMMGVDASGNEYCPVCEAVKNGCHNEAWWIESASVEQFLKAQELGLIPKEPMTQ